MALIAFNSVAHPNLMVSRILGRAQIKKGYDGSAMLARREGEGTASWLLKGAL